MPFQLKLFLDANIFIAGSVSQTGGSAFIIEACKRGIFKTVTARFILREAERNIKKKFGSDILSRFYKIIADLPLEIQPLSDRASEYERIIQTKDAPVLATAIDSQSEFLITLDKKHFKVEKVIQKLRKKT